MIKVLGVETDLRTGGGERAFFDLFTNLDRRHFDPYVACCYELGTLGIRLKTQGMTVFDRLFQSQADLTGGFRLARLCRQLNVDILYTSGHPLTMFWGQVLCKLDIVKSTVASIHSTGGAGESKRRILATMLPFTRYVALSEAHKDYLIQMAGIPAERLRVVPNGIDPHLYGSSPGLERPRGLPNGVPLVGIVAMLRPEKSHETLINAAASIQHLTDAHFVVVGDGPQRESIERRISERQLDARFHLLGVRDDVPNLLRTFDVVVLCSKDTVETLPISLMEAMACSKPVVATNVGSVANLVTHEVNGLIVDVGDDEAMARSILRLLENPMLAARMGSNGRQEVLAKYSLGSTVQAMQEVFFECFNQSKS